MSEKFVDNQSKAKLALFYAGKAAARKAARAIAKEAKSKLTSSTGRSKNYMNVATRGKKDEQARAQVGYYQRWKMKEKGKEIPRANASWLENGTKPHLIKVGQTSSKGVVLSKTGKRLLSNGVLKFGTWFNHPGTKARKPLVSAAQTKTEVVAKCAQEYYSKLSDLYKKEESFFSDIAKAAGGEGDVDDDGE